MAWYSNVNFPAKPDYDILSYPFAVAVFSYPVGAQDWSEVELYYSAASFSYDSVMGCVTNPESGALMRSYSVSRGSWSEEQELSEQIMLFPGLGKTRFLRIWSEQLISDEEGRVYLAAGKVTTADWYGLNSWMSGVMQGMNQMPFRAVWTGAPEFEPQYRYNELILPGLPSLITSQEYVVIGWVPSQSCYRVWAGPNIRRGYNNQTLVSSASIALTFYIADYGTDGKWSEPRSQRVSNNSSITTYAVEPVWCNLDLIEVNSNAVILEGSAPESVARMDPDVKYDPAIWSLGWHLGQWIAKHRSGTEAQ